MDLPAHRTLLLKRPTHWWSVRAQPAAGTRVVAKVAIEAISEKRVSEIAGATHYDVVQAGGSSDPRPATARTAAMRRVRAGTTKREPTIEHWRLFTETTTRS